MNNRINNNLPLIITALALMAVVLVVICAWLKKKENQDNETAENLIPEIRNFYFDLSGKYIAHSDELAVKNKFADLYSAVSKLVIRPKNSKYGAISKFKNDYKNIHGFIEGQNREFIDSEKAKYDYLLSDIDGRSLDDQQREAVISDEDHNLVIAGAGSGKTLTISGKVKYLCETKGIKPEDILLITFTRKAAQEMTDRIADRLGYNVQATTFHKLGLDILKMAKKKTYDVKDDIRQFFEDYFEKTIGKDKKMLQALMNFFAYYLQLPTDLNNFDSLGDVYEHEKSMDLETIKSRYDKASYAEEKANEVYDERISLKRERVKSLQEVEIANFLFLHGIRYEYEALYRFQDKTSERRAYKPDFYLPGYDIYIEHFGVNRNNKCPWLSPIEEEKYVEDMKWKKDTHRQNGTKLVCTYSYYYSEGILLSKLEELLLKEGVEFKEIDIEEIFNAVYVKQGKKYFSEFISLCCTFISLFKSNGYKLNDLEGLNYKSKQYNNAFFRNRLDLFKDIIYTLIDEYNTYLRDAGAFDFSDMIIESTEAIKEGFRVHDYKYVIIDEYQDTSVARYKLVKAILDQTKAKLFCVGDDWQSIYRFAGSDISLFTSFEKYFGYTKTTKIEKTYRNSQELIDEVGRFIMMNPQQIKKNLLSDKRTDKPIVFLRYSDSNRTEVIKKIFDAIFLASGKGASVLLLGRTNYDFEIIKESNLFYGKNFEELHYKASPETPITFMTVHRSKGLEADNVVLLNFENSIMGFPNKIADDPILETVLSELDQYIYAEERRLLYVALTRTKNRSYVLTNADCPSEFIKDFPETDNTPQYGKRIDVKDTQSLCPRCKTGHLVKRINEKTHKTFIGCSNYPKCTYAINDVKAVENNNICPRCGGFLTLRTGKRGAFYGCSNYPKCTYTKEYKERKYCPKCGSELKLRKGTYGLFWGCSNYPRCKYIEKEQ